MTRPAPSSLAVAAGCLVGMSLATFTPGLLFVAQAMDALRGQSIAIGFHVVIAAWGALTGGLVVRERFMGNSRGSLGLIPLYSGIYLLTGSSYTLVESAQGGSQAFGALLLFGSISLGITLASLVVAVATWLLMRRFATALVQDSLPSSEATVTIARRASRWLLGAAALQVATCFVGGPVLSGVIAACGSVWFFWRARPLPKFPIGLISAAAAALVGSAVQLTLLQSQAEDSKRSALPACADGESEPVTQGAYGRRARAVPGVRDAIALLRLDPSQAPRVAYKVFVSIVPISESAAPDVQRAVERALVAVDCDEGQQLRRVPTVVRAPANRALEAEALVLLRPGTALDGVRAELEPKLRATLARTPLSASGPRLSLPVASDLSGIEQITWRINGAPYLPGEALAGNGEAEMPTLAGLVVRESTREAGAR